MATFDAHSITAVAKLASDYTLDVKSGTVTLDDSWEPYIQATLICYAPPSATLEQIDPRLTLRVVVTVTQKWGDGTVNWNSFGYRAPVTRTFNLSLRERAIDKNTGELTLTLGSDEALLQNYKHPVAANERTYGLSIATAVNFALGKLGASLATGYDDANLLGSALDSVATNLIANPSFETNTVGWGIASNNNTIARSTAQAYLGTACLAINTTTAGTIGAQYGAATAIPCVPGDQHTFSFYARASAPGFSATAIIRYTNGTSNLDTSGTTTLITSTDWTLITVSASCPTGLTGLNVYFVTNGAPVGTVVYIDAASVMANSSKNVAYFDGSYAGAGRDTAIYTAAWTGTAHASTSTLTEQPNSDATIWKPGIAASDWLQTMLQAGNLRLWCDEARVWRLKKDWSLPDLITVASSTGLTSASDTISLSDNDDWYDSVVLGYHWTDDLGTSHDVYDVAGTAGKNGLTIDYTDTVFPGYGAAANILMRATGKGRVLDLVAVSNYVTTPGMNLSATLPDSSIQSGQIRAVAWSFSDSGSTMTITSRGLTTTPAGAWTLAVGPWTAATGPWTAATGSN
jgi:hypothetical protein